MMTAKHLGLGPLLAVLLSVTLSIVGAPAASAQDNGQLVIRVADGESVTAVAAQYKLDLVKPLLRSRNLWVVQPSERWRFDTNAKLAYRASWIQQRSSAVEYAERYDNNPYGDTRMRAWPYGQSSSASVSESRWRDQPHARSLGLPVSGADGDGVWVAVLDTGMTSGNPNYTNLWMGYDYIDDNLFGYDKRQNLDTSGDGIVDGAYGHGTFVAGQVNLVAPQARIRGYRVLDSDGVGNPYVIAEAIDDAVDAGASVINMSFGSGKTLNSKPMSRAFARAKANGVVMVTSAGNTGESKSLFPANGALTLSVGCADEGTGRRASFSSYGSWVNVAAPCEDTLGYLPSSEGALWSGTSLSAPLVAGQVALIRQRYPNLSREAVIGAVKGTATPRRDQGAGSMPVVDIAKSIRDAPNYG